MYPTIENIKADCSKGTVQKSSGLPGSYMRIRYTPVEVMRTLRKASQTLLSAGKCQPDRSLGTLFFSWI